jgi:hypothetical protein
MRPVDGHEDRCTGKLSRVTNQIPQITGLLGKQCIGALSALGVPGSPAAGQQRLRNPLVKRQTE